MNRHLMHLGLAALLSSCGSGTHDKSQLNERRIDPAVGVAILGTGYDSHSENFTSVCTRPTGTPSVIYAGQQRSELRFQKSVSFEELKNLLEVQVKGKLMLDGFTGSAGAKFLAEASNTDLSKSLVFVADVRGKTAILNSPDLTAKAIETGQTMRSDLIRAECGDEFVDGVDLGGQFFVNVKFEFANAAVKSDFEAEIDLDFVSLFQVSGAAKVAYEKYKKNVEITITAYQVGGNVSQLPTVFRPSDTGAIPIVDCDLEHPAACQTALSEIVKYASQSFPEQIKDLSYDPTKPNGAAFLGYRTKTYYGAGLRKLYPAPSEVLGREITEARTRLLDRYEIQAKDRRRATLLMKMRLNGEEKTRIDGIDAILSRNITKLVNASQVCYERPIACVDEESKVVLETYDPTKLFKERRFIDYCDQTKQAETIATTIKSIKEYLQSQPSETCDEVLSDLNQSLSLKLKNLKDLRPLFGLDKLRELDVSGGTINNLSTLSSLPHLRNLNLRSNNVSSVADLENLTELTQLDLANNRLVDLEPLRKLQKLRVLKLQSERNRVFDWDPVDHYPAIEILYKDFDQICAVERNWALSQKLISDMDYSLYESANFAPMYLTPGVRSSSISGWANCVAISSDF